MRDLQVRPPSGIADTLAPAVTPGRVIVHQLQRSLIICSDGRAIIKGTNDIDKARVLYAKYIGH